MTGRWLEAEASLRTAVELDPREPIIHDAVALHLLAPCGQLRGAYERSCQAIDLAPATDYLRLNCAGFALMSGRVDEAAVQFENASRLGVSQRSLFKVMKAELAGARGEVGAGGRGADGGPGRGRAVASRRRRPAVRADPASL
jgi:Flp pilus assembly protein TadD